MSASSDASPQSNEHAIGHVALVGLMGSGKSTVGRIVADKLDRQLIDTDELVERATGTSIAELFASRGEAAFRRYELDSLRRAIARNTPAVIATGGGVVTIDDARQILIADATVVWLRVDPEVLASRLSDDTTRPLLGERKPLDVLRELHEHRTPLYEQVADAIIDGGHAEPQQVADQVLDVLGLRT